MLSKQTWHWCVNNRSVRARVFSVLTFVCVPQNYGLPSGLVNLDNTCYMNSTVEMLRTVPELKSALLSYVSPAGAFDGQVSLTTAFRDVIGQLEISRDAVTPRTFFSVRGVSESMTEPLMHYCRFCDRSSRSLHRLVSTERTCNRMPKSACPRFCPPCRSS